jgi:hypothetical protein
MSIIEHNLYLNSPTGMPLAVITDSHIVSLGYGLKVNEAGVCDLTLPGDFDISLLFIDGMFEIERAYAGNSMRIEGDTSFFIRKISRGTLENGTRVINITAYSALDLMGRRIVAYPAGSSYTEKISEHWDDMTRQIVKENYGSLASDPARNLSPWLTVEADRSAGPSYIRSMPWRIVSNVLTDIINDIRSRGTYCTYDVFRVGAAQYEFRVFIGPRGMDHSSTSAQPVIVSEQRRNLLNPSLEKDWQTEHNFIYATGQGQEDARIIKTAQDNTRINISPFNRQEYNQDSRADKMDESVQADANSALEEFRPKQTFTGLISQTEGCIYGIHWGWGDIVTAEYAGQSFNCYVETVSVSIGQDGTEIVTGYLRSVQDVQ